MEAMLFGCIATQPCLDQQSRKATIPGETGMVGLRFCMYALLVWARCVQHRNLTITVLRTYIISQGSACAPCRGYGRVVETGC